MFLLVPGLDFLLLGLLFLLLQFPFLEFLLFVLELPELARDVLFPFVLLPFVEVVVRFFVVPFLLFGELTLCFLVELPAEALVFRKLFHFLARFIGLLAKGQGTQASD